MARLESICRVIVDGDWIESKDQSESGIRLIQTGNIGVGEYLDKINRAKYVTADTFERLKCTEVFPGDILISRLPDPIGRACAVPQNVGKAITAVDCTIVRLDPALCDINYFINYTQSVRYSNELSKFLAGTTRTRISRKNLEKIDIPLPPLEEQRRIASVLDKVSDLIAKRRAQMAKLDLLVKSRFVEMFGDCYTNPYNLPIAKWSDVFNTTTGKLDSNAAVDNGEYPFFTCSKETLRIDKYAFDQEALLLAGNNAAGKYDVKYYKGKFNAYQRTYVLSLKQNWSYALFRFQLEDKLGYLEQQSLGGLTKYLTLKILNELNFVVPEKSEQDKFAAFVKRIDKSKLTIQQSLDKLETLKKALMQQCFG